MGGIRIHDKIAGAWRAVKGSDQRLDVSARSNTRAFYNNRDKECLFAWLSEFGCSAGNYISYIKNTDSTRKLYVEHIHFGSDANQVFYIHKVTGTATGSTIIGRNQNYAESNPAIGTFYGDAAVGGLTSTWKSKAIRVPANHSGLWTNSGGILLNNGEALAIQAKNAAGIDATAIGYYE